MATSSSASYTNFMFSSSAPLVLDALPVLKVRHYYGTGTQNNVYSYARFYLCNGSLQMGLYNFLRTPTANDELLLLFAQSENIFCVSLTCDKAALYTTNKIFPPKNVEPIATFAAPESSYFAGNDEQGWYWGATLCVDAKVLQQNGFLFDVGSNFGAALLYRKKGSDNFGASFSVATDAPITAQTLPRFQVMNY